nr:hypothetical protein [Massilia sp. JS1662]
MNANKTMAPPAATRLYDLARGGTLDRQTRIRIALYLARRGQGVFESTSLRTCGRAAGMNGAEMAANEAGTSHDAKGTACLAFVRTLLDVPGAPSAHDLDGMAEVGYRASDIAEVITQVGINRDLHQSPGAIADCARLQASPQPSTNEQEQP